MKDLTLSIFLLLGLLVSCSKAKEEKQEEAIRRFEVLEYKTNIPIDSVQIQFLRCSNYDIQFGCQAREIFLTGFTDHSGRYAVRQSVLHGANGGIKLQKSNYWSEVGQTGMNYLSPEGWINIHLIRQNVYAFPRLFFNYDIDGESGFTRIDPVMIPVDTIIKVRAFGNEVNKLNWQIGTGTHPILTGGTNITTILANGTLTQNPGRFETTSVTVLY